jgi:hypothetical protein
VLDVRSGTCRHFCPGLHTALARMSGAEPSVLVLLVAGHVGLEGFCRLFPFPSECSGNARLILRLCGIL